LITLIYSYDTLYLGVHITYPYLKRIMPYVIIILVAVSSTYVYYTYHSKVLALKIFCAGSLKIPLDNLSTIFTANYHYEVYIEPSGSIEAIRKVIDLNKACDIIAVADYRLIPMYLVPKYTTWFIAFAANQIVLVYTNKSKYADELAKNPDRWFQILSKPYVRYGFSDPNKDPCGYRAIGVIALASILYNDSSILNNLLLSKIDGIRCSIFKNETVHVYVSPNISPHGNLIIRPKSVDLISLLESGAIDYAFEYRSVAIQHKLNFISLPKEINLGDPSLDNFYSKVVVHILSGTDKEKAIPMKSIVYGVAVLNESKNKQLALEFVKLLLSDKGKKVFEEYGQPPLKEAIGYGNVPKELEEYVKKS